MQTAQMNAESPYHRCNKCLHWSDTYNYESLLKLGTACHGTVSDAKNSLASRSDNSNGCNTRQGAVEKKPVMSSIASDESTKDCAS